MIPVFGGLAAIQTALIFVWGRLFASADYQTYSVIRWALAEAVAVYGLVLCFLGAPETTSGAFFGWALLSLFRLRPSAEDYQRFLGLKRQKTNHKSP
jgi:hypothetical protein